MLVLVSIIIYLHTEAKGEEKETLITKVVNTNKVIAENYSDYNIEISSSTDKVITKNNIQEVEEMVEFIETEEVGDEPEKFNKDYLGSITIPEINLNETIYRSEGEFYLSHNYLGEYDELGEVYLDDRSASNIHDSGALLNGHAVKNGIRFGTFKKLLDIDNQPNLYLMDYTTGVYYTYKLLFVSLIDASTQGVVMDFEDEYRRYIYYSRLYDNAIKKWQEPTLGAKYLLLNSCSYIISNGRYLVVAERT